MSYTEQNIQSNFENKPIMTLRDSSSLYQFQMQLFCKRQRL